MSQGQPPSHDSSTKGATIKIAAKEASQRTSSGGADPGPGDPNAAPSVAPQLVDIPDPPTGSQLVVKSTSGTKPQSVSNLPTLNEGRSGTGPSTKGSGPKSIIQANMSNGGGSKMSGSQMGPAASQASGGAAREPTSSKQLSGVPQSKVENSAVKSTVSGAGTGSKVGASQSQMGSTGGGPSGAGGASSMGSKSATAAKSVSGAPSGAGSKSVSGAPGSKSATGAGPKSATSPVTASAAMQADSGVVHDEDEEGEGELEHPDDGASPSPASPGGASASGAAGGKSVSGAGKSTHSKSASQMPESSGMSERPGASSSGAASSSKDGKKNKVTKFRYHKRIVVRTKGNANPSTIMDKVNKKAGNTRITPSTIEDMDPQELMKRAGIKGSNKTHWRVRLRQTKRLTKNGKTTTQTKVAYRDSEGNKRVKTSLSPYCKHCGKKLEDCKCESSSQS